MDPNVPPESPPPPPPTVEPLQLPAMFLLITAGLGALLQIALLLMSVLGIGLAAMEGELAQIEALIGGGFNIFGIIIALAVAGVIAFGALKMKSGESWTWGLAASILAMIPCVSPCCFLGLPIGIWAIVILNKPEVKAAFPK